MKRLDPRLGPFDHVLAALACLLAVYSISMSLNNPALAAFFSIGTVVTALGGYGLAQIVRGTKIGSYDSYFWAVTGMFATGFVNVLNGMLPGGGFPFELLAAAILCWVLLIGNLFAWRDQTLIFLSLPCIAIFGLVGTFDTFQPATVLFFVFMLTIAVLYARIHQRSMIERARRAGVEEPELLRRGAWKWMAGPEWALASALVIILFSFMGAPVLQTSLSPVAGRVQVSLPQQQQQNQPSAAVQEVSDVNVGTGPTRLTEQLVVKVKMDRPRYLRQNSYSTYTGTGWKASQATLPAGSPLVNRTPNRLAPERGPAGGLSVWPGHETPPIEPIEDGQRVEFTLKESNVNLTSVIAPGPIVEIVAAPQAVTFLAQGWVVLDEPLKSSDVLTGYALVPDAMIDDQRAELPPTLEPLSSLYLSKDSIPSRVRDLAYRATAGATTDYAKALAIKREIERRVVYNIKAAKTPEDKDPVEHFLFESQEGYCDLFASSMAVMARSVGLPSRYVIGYIVNDPERDDDGFYTIRAKDYHAWCEIYFEGLGWIPFDPTEGAPSVDGGERGATEGGTVWYKTGWFVGTMLGVLVLAILTPVLVLIRQRTLSPEARSERAATEVGRLHAVFTRTIERFVGAPKRFSQTTYEYIASVGPKLGAVSGEAGALVREFEVAMFSQTVTDKSKLLDLSKRISSLRSALSAQKRKRP